MPIYVYEIVKPDDTGGEQFEVLQRMSEAALKVHPQSGLPVRRVIQCPRAASPSIWNGFESEALACDPSQVAEMNERNKNNGVGARYDPEGMCHIPDRADRKKLLKLEGMHDKSAGYGD